MEPSEYNPPSLSSLSARLAALEHQSNTILFMGAVNLIMNVLTIAFGFLLSM
jgi:hypothetical protein